MNRAEMYVKLLFGLAEFYSYPTPIRCGKKTIETRLELGSNPRAFEFFCAYYGVFGARLTVLQLAERNGISKSRVRQIIDKAEHRLKRRMQLSTYANLKADPNRWVPNV